MMLKGIRVVEGEGLGPAPFASMLLADLGADVIVVHRPRNKSSASSDSTDPKPGLLDRGKRSIALNLKDPDDVDIFTQLVDSSDALIEGFRPGVMERLGLGPADCMATNKRLVYGRMTGWGQIGPMASMAGHDLNYIGMSGAATAAVSATESPYPTPTLVGDIGGGALYLVVGVLSGILNAQRTGEGTVVDAAIVDGSAHMMNLLLSLQQGSAESAALCSGLIQGAHFSRCYQTSDGKYMSVQCLEPHFYHTFLGVLGLNDDEAFTAQYDQKQWHALAKQLEVLFATKSRSEWESLFMNTDACVAPVLSPQEAHEHSTNQQRQVWMRSDGVLQSAKAPRFSSVDHTPPVQSPSPDEHRQEILNELKL